MRIMLLLIGILFLLPFSAEAQIFKKKKEPKYDTLRNGKYTEYWDRDSTHLNARGHFCDGAPCKRWKYYHYDGVRRMKVKYRDKLKIKYYSDEGRLSHKGYAILETNSRRTHFYWHGIWKYYDKKRKLYRKALYAYGEESQLIFGPEDPYYEE